MVASRGWTGARRSGRVMAQTADRPLRFGFRPAVVVSLGVHFLLFLAVSWVQLLTPLPQSEFPRVDSIALTFTPEVGQEAKSSVKSELILPHEPRAAPAEPVAPLRRPPTPPRETEQVPVEVPAETVQQPTPADVGIARPEAKVAASKPGTAGPATRSPGGSPQLDINQALRDFGRKLARAGSSGAAGSQGKGDGGNVFVPDLSAYPLTGYGMGNLEFESRDYDWGDYAREVYWAIWRAWHNRLWATSSDFEKWAHETQQWILNNQSQIRFVIESSGQVSGIVLEGTDGCGPLDESAIDALAEVILPPLPADFPRNREVVHARFLARGEILSMRTALSRHKARGDF